MTTENKSICPYPFKHSYIGSRYERKLCCLSKDIDQLRKTANKEFWNSDKLKSVRLDMLEGKPIDDCSVCYKFEALGIQSLRQMSIEGYGETEKEIENRFRSVTRSDGSLDHNPSYFDYRTIHCNLQCVSCGTHFSSTHINLHEKMYGEDKTFVIDYDFEDNMAQEIIDSIRNKECNAIYWAGGEPMSSHIHWKVIECMMELLEKDEYKDYLKQLHTHYNTNMTKLYWKGRLIPEMLSFFQPSMQPSIDGTHETFEYCRDGGTWSEVSKNWDEYYSRLNEKNQFGIASVMSAPVILDIDRWFNFFEEYDPILYNHRLFVATESNKDTNGRHIGDNFLDIRLFPDDIFYPAVNHAIYRFEKSTLRNKQHTIDILSAYIDEKRSKNEFFSNNFLLQSVKKKTMYRDLFLVKKRSYGDLLKIINPDAYEWYLKL